MSTAILPKLDTSLGGFRWFQNWSIDAATSQFVLVQTEPVVYRVPNAESLAALEEVANNEAVTFASWDAFFADLYDDDEC